MSFRHFKSLLFRQARIQEKIESEQRRPWPDWIRLLKLKKLRLIIKDKIERMVQSDTQKRQRIGNKRLAPSPIRISRNR